MFLLLDNYDSFVHNLARYLRCLGCETMVVRSDQIDAAGCKELEPDAIVISPGPKRPKDAGCSVEVIRELGGAIPMLGVCLGHQAIAVAFGGTVNECGPVHGMASQITHDGTGLFTDFPSPMQVGRYHSLAVDRSTLPKAIEITATSDDGLIMAMQHRSMPIYGVQFHPESVLTQQGLNLMGNFRTLVSQQTRELAP